MELPARRLLPLVGIGLAVGFFSGLFGVGGGIILVPLLIVVAGFAQRLASGTSLAVVLPTSVAGLIGYAAHGSVDWAVGATLAVGAVGGSLVGTWALHRVPQLLLRWIFVVFLLVVAVRLFFLVPDRSGGLELDGGTVLGLLALGLVVGVLSGLLGIGGGVVIVPALMILFGVSDLAAKGISLLAMIPTSVTGTLANLKRGNTDLRAAAVVALFAIPASFGGVAVSVLMPPAVGSVLFALLLIVSAAQLSWNAWRQRRSVS